MITRVNAIALLEKNIGHKELKNPEVVQDMQCTPSYTFNNVFTHVIRLKVLSEFVWTIGVIDLCYKIRAIHSTQLDDNRLDEFALMI